MLFFLDESGTDHKNAPYEILAGVAIQEQNMWPLIQEFRGLERYHFGILLNEAKIELKGSTFLKNKNFRFAGQDESIPIKLRTPLVKSFLQKNLQSKSGYNPKYLQNEFTAFGQASIDFIRDIYKLSAQKNLKVFASIVPINVPKPKTNQDFLRKDYLYLFERFFNYLQEGQSNEMGILIFDERDRNFCVRLCSQIEAYFTNTRKGKLRSTRIMPQPLFVHSDLTTAVQIVDIVAYSINWGLRLKGMKELTRPEMEEFGENAQSMQYTGKNGSNKLYGIKYIQDLRPKSQRKKGSDSLS